MTDWIFFEGYRHAEPSLFSSSRGVIRNVKCAAGLLLCQLAGIV